MTQLTLLRTAHEIACDDLRRARLRGDTQDTARAFSAAQKALHALMRAGG